jgi:hypothetical protein
MSPQVKKTTWIAGLQLGLVVTLLGVAYSAGLKMSTATHEIARVDERIGDAEEDIAHGKHDFKVHVKDNAEDMDQINGHLHQIDIQLTEQTQILKRIERKDE